MNHFVTTESLKEGRPQKSRQVDYNALICRALTCSPIRW